MSLSSLNTWYKKLTQFRQMLINAESEDGSAHFSWLPYNPNPLVDENLRGLTYFKLDNSWTQSNLITSNTLLQSLVDGNVVLAG